MSRTITIRITQSPPNIGPFNIYDEYNTLIAENVSKADIIKGVSYSVDNNVNL